MPTKSNRIIWIDSAKGFAITLVVFGHVLGGIMARGWVDPNGVWRQVYNYVYLFHMPLFFMISGLFYIETIRRSLIEAFVSRIKSIAWPYFFWDFFIRTAALPLISSFMSSPPNISWSAAFSQALTGELSWFLWTLFVMQVLLIPFSRAPIWFLFVISVVCALYFGESQIGSFHNVIANMPFLLFGALLRPVLDDLKCESGLTTFLLSFSTFIFIALALLVGWTTNEPMVILCGITGSLALIIMVQYFPAPIERTVANIGIASLAIYVLHPYFQGVSREVILRTLGAGPLWQLLLPTIVAVGGPFLVWWLAQRFGMSWLFRLGRSARSHNVE